VNRLALAVGLLSLVGVVSCRGDVSADPPVHLQRNMFSQERYDPQAFSPFFEDNRSMRSPVDGTVSREHYEADDAIATGRLADNSGYVLTVPSAIAARLGGPEKMVQRGQERFNIYCTPCHDKGGTGNGTVARVPNGFAKLPSLHDARLREAPDGQIFATITNGVRMMPSYAAQVPVNDRWAIVAYVRALQMSQAANNEGKK
jgi:mono/diheme cytochrome c family protein